MNIIPNSPASGDPEHGNSGPGGGFPRRIGKNRRGRRHWVSNDPLLEADRLVDDDTVPAPPAKRSIWGRVAFVIALLAAAALIVAGVWVDW